MAENFHNAPSDRITDILTRALGGDLDRYNHYRRHSQLGGISPAHESGIR